MIGPILVLVAGLGLALLAASVGVAVAIVSQHELTRWVQYRLRGASAASVLRENPARVVATANALTTFGLVVAAAALSWVAGSAGPVVVGAGTVLLVVPAFLAGAYAIPRMVGRRWADRLVARAAPVLERAARWLGPALPEREQSARALAAVLSGSEASTLSNANEMAIVGGVLAFTDRPVRELMTPRTGLVAVPEGMPAGEAAHVFGESGYSRYPVYRGSLDDVAGVAYAIDLLGKQPDEPVPVRPALLVPDTTHAGDVLREMQRGHSHVAVVLDQFGGTAGLVTFDDLLRSLLADLFGEPPGSAAGEEATAVLECDGGAPLARVAEALGVTLASREVQTVGGLLIQRLGRIPRAGERFQMAGLEVDVLAAGATRVDRVLVRRAPVRTVPLDGAGDGP